MKKTKTVLSKLLAVVLCAVMAFGFVPLGFSQEAMAFDANDPSVFLHQPKDGDSTCVFTSCLNMFRRRAIIDGDSEWSSITHSNYSSAITTNGVSVRFTITNVRGMNASMNSSLTSDKKSYFISMLNNHPEGIVIYCGSSPMHTVLLTDYDSSTDTFYCAETLSAFGYGRIPLTSCYLSTYNGGLSQAGVISKISQIWYITNRSGGSIDPPTPPSNAWVALPNGPESSYLPNTEVDITFGADNATSYYVEMYRKYNGQTDFYYNITLSAGVLQASFDKLGHYSCYVVASNSAGSTTSGWIGWDIVDAPPTNVWVAVPNGPESSYLPNTTVDITFGADYADTYRMTMCREYNGVVDWEYYSESFRKSPTGNDVCHASFDKPGHYSCCIWATNMAGGTYSEWVGWDIVETKPSELSITADESYYAVNSTVNFTLNAKYGYYKHIGIHKILDTGNQLYYEQDVAGTSCSVTITEPGNYCANFDAFNACGMTRSDLVYFSVFDKKPEKPIVTIIPGTNQTETKISWNATADTKYYDIYLKDGNGNLIQYVTDYKETAYSLVLPKGTYQVNVCSCGYVYDWWTSAGYQTFVICDTPVLNPADSDVVINRETHLIYGLSAGGAQGCVAVTDGTAAYEYPTAKQAMGTGTKVNVYNNDNVLVDSYTVVVFGDIDGDSWYDGTDAYFVRLVASGMVSANLLTAAQRTACDANHDGAIDEADVVLIEKAGLLLNGIDQTAPQEELQTNSVYLEYCSLIDQNIEITEPDQPTAEEPTQSAEQEAQPATQTVLNWLKSFFTIVLNWLLRIF